MKHYFIDNKLLYIRSDSRFVIKSVEDKLTILVEIVTDISSKCCSLLKFTNVTMCGYRRKLDNNFEFYESYAYDFYILGKTLRKCHYSTWSLLIDYKCPATDFVQRDLSSINDISIRNFLAIRLLANSASTFTRNMKLKIPESLNQKQKHKKWLEKKKGLNLYWIC